MTPPDLNELASRIEGLSESQRRDIIALGDPKNPYGGLFDALSVADTIEFKRLGLIRHHIPAGCMAPLTKLTPRGVAVREALLDLARPALQDNKGGLHG